MKKFTLFVAAAALVTTMFQSCEKVKEVVKAEVDINSTEVSFDIPIVSTTSPGAAMGTFTTSVNVDSIIKAANAKLGAGNITSAKITKMKIVITNSDSSNNFANLKNCSAMMSSNAKQDNILIASVSDNPDVFSSELVFAPQTDIELKDYFDANSFTYNLTGEMRRTTNTVLHAKATISYHILIGL